MVLIARHTQASAQASPLAGAAHPAAMPDAQSPASPHIAGRLNVQPEPRLGELRTRLEALAGSQRDMVVSTRELALAPADGALMVGGSERYALREHAFAQLAAKLAIPAPYLRRCDAELQARNVNRWLREQDREVLLRLEGPEVRAVLGASYRPINHLHILGWLGAGLGDATPVRFELTEGSLDLQVIDPAARGRDALHGGLHLRNSETGQARVQISALVYRTICLNGLVMGGGRWAFQRRHVGRAELAQQVREAFQQALELSAQAVSAFAGTQAIRVAEPVKALSRIAARYELSAPESDATVRAFDVEPGHTLYAVINALTRAGNDSTLTLDSRHKLQTLGGRLTDLSATGRWLEN